MIRRGRMARRRLLCTLTLCALMAAPAASFAQTPDQTRAADKAAAAKADREDGQGGCVYITQLQGDHPLNDRAVIFRANVNDFYRLDFAQRCVELTYPEPKLIITPAGGMGLVCHAIDLDVKVGDQGPGSFAVPCIPSAFHKMTPAEVAAVPRKDLP